jgi:hypothetical protein
LCVIRPLRHLMERRSDVRDAPGRSSHGSIDALVRSAWFTS